MKQLKRRYNQSAFARHSPSIITDIALGVLFLRLPERGLNAPAGDTRICTTVPFKIKPSLNPGNALILHVILAPLTMLGGSPRRRKPETACRSASSSALRWVVRAQLD
jgi:hypothetical protein